MVKKSAKPNILVIFGDDIGMWNLSCYSDGMMGYRTPNIDRLAKEGMKFTDAYGEQSCTAGRASFITGQSCFRTGLSKVGVPGATVGLKAEDPTIAELLKNQGYATGQFGKNHLGDRNEYLPTVHGFDEFYGNLYHLNAEEEPEMADYPSAKDFPEFRKKFGPRGVLRCRATEKDDPTEEERWGRVGKQTIEDTGALTKKRMETCDDDFVASANDFMSASGRRGQTILLLGQHHSHAPVHAYQARKPGASGQVAVALSRHHDRSRQEYRRVARQFGQTGYRGQHVRTLYHRQRPAHEHVARRRHDPVPQREEHKLGRRFPCSLAGAMAGEDRRRIPFPTKSSSTTTGCRPFWPWQATRTSSRS